MNTKIQFKYEHCETQDKDMKEEMKSKKLLYFEPVDACCENGSKSQEQLLKERAVVGIAYLVDEITGEEWGDDWNDAPKCSNAGAPYEGKCVGLEVKEIKLGEPII